MRSDSERKAPSRYAGVVPLACFAALLLGSPVLARPGSGFGDLIDTYCIDRGRLRVRAHQPHCAMCHHLGTFDTSPEHRVEPNWTQFIRGRDTGNFSFFCPGAVDDAVVARAPGETMPSGPKATTADNAERATTPMGTPPGGDQAAAASQPAKQADAAPSGKEMAPPADFASQGPISSEELSQKMAALHDTVGIEPSQEPAWLELLDATAQVVRRPSPAEPASTDPVALLKRHELQSSKHVAALRALGTALARLNAKLDEKQRRALIEGLAPVLNVGQS
ncbi:MAG: hypothetical protein JHD07_02115 [Bradyrhizobium sp.]|uniref:hypothetical protein n=1 Tax=Bradyrhizobium sp. TaxID=376 RepID=UPI001A230FBA|nr:hypothetical protein [Bradyrhizobium sp.]MBJ7402147.1 hypothetical protein [Bradyrhizobium sp.]